MSQKPRDDAGKFTFKGNPNAALRAVLAAKRGRPLTTPKPPAADDAKPTLDDLLRARLHGPTSTTKEN